MNTGVAYICRTLLMGARTLDPRLTPFRLKVGTSRIHRLGVFADQRIPRGRKVIEYTGERVSFAEARRRWNPTLNYLFAPEEGVIIDGSIGGSGAQYINHCCVPNLGARFMRGHLLFFSLRSIATGEELTLDYKYQGGGRETYPCRCGAHACRGTMILARRDTRSRRAPRRFV